MSKLRKISGKECIKILCNKFGFSVIRQKGSHVILRKETPDGSIGTVVPNRVWDSKSEVPNHKELKLGTLKGILELARIKEEEFAEYI